MLEHVWQQQLSPLDLLERAQWVYPEKTAIVHGKRRISYRDFYAEVQRLAAALAQAGVRKGDRVAALLPNIPPMLVAHFAPLHLGWVLVAVNVRLSTRTLAYIRGPGGP